MKKNYLFILSLLLTVILVVGCNTTEKTEDNDSNQNAPSNSATQETPADSEAVEDDTQDSSTQTDQNTNTSSTSKQEIKYEQNGVDKKEMATESQSADQNYKLHQLPGFTLSPEEPGKDIYVSNDDDQVFMRVETISTTDNTYDNVKSSLVEYMNAVGTTTPLPADMLKVFKEAKSAEGYEVDFESEKVIGVVIEKDDLIVKLTIHDNDTQDLTAAMLAMAATITQK